MYADKDKNIINDNEAFTDSKGVKYPSNFPKDEIGELTKVTETDMPVDSSLVVVDFSVDGNYNQVWETRTKIASELSTEDKNKWLSELAEMDLSMPRSLEDIIDVLSATAKGNLAIETKNKYDAKKAKRQEGIDKGHIA